MTWHETWLHFPASYCETNLCLWEDYDRHCLKGQKKKKKKELKQFIREKKNEWSSWRSVDKASTSGLCETIGVLCNIDQHVFMEALILRQKTGTRTNISNLGYRGNHAVLSTFAYVAALLDWFPHWAMQHSQTLYIYERLRASLPVESRDEKTGSNRHASLPPHCLFYTPPRYPPD